MRQFLRSELSKISVTGILVSLVAGFVAAMFI